ncbi:MAG: HEAT repeat domain-containing protein [Promethearchaeota archaeon]
MLVEIFLVLIFFVFFSVGFFIIYKQVALVKKGEFNIKDTLQCVVYGVVFGISVMVVMSMGFIFAVKSQDFWVHSPTPPPDIHPFALLIPLLFCLIYISIYPLIDFLYIALSKETDEGLTPFQKIISNRLINITKSKFVSFIMAILLYVGLFVLPPILLASIGIPFLMIWTSFMLVYPLLILTFYGSKGYIAGLSNCYYHIPEIKRMAFLGFEDKKRSFRQFKTDPGSYILMGLMLFVFVWAWISMIQTIAFFFTGKMGFSTMSSVFVFVTLLFGIVGYFTRFWGRKIKYRAIDIYFAAYLMAAIGVNVFVNFLIVNADKLTVLNTWALTSQAISNAPTYAFAAAIEETVLIIFTSYFLIKSSASFNVNIKYSKITECGQKFDPIPLFTLIKNKNPKIQQHAENTLVLMFERIPLKTNVNLGDSKFMDYLFDGISDYNPISRRICTKILSQLEKDASDVVLPHVISALASPNYDKSIGVARTLLESEVSFIEKIPRELLLKLVNDAEWRLRQIGLKLVSKLVKRQEDLIDAIDINKLLKDPDKVIQAEILKIVLKTQYKLPLELIIEKTKSSREEIRSAAVKALKNISIQEGESSIISKVKSLINDPNSSVRAAIYKLLASIKNLEAFHIHTSMFLDGLTDSNEKVRKSSIMVLERYYEKDPKSFNVDEIINKIDYVDLDVANSVILLIGKLWKNNPRKILSILLSFIKSDNEKLRNLVSNILVEKSSKDQKLILKNLIEIPDESKFITKGIIASTIIQIARKNPKKVISKLLKYTGSDVPGVAFNAVSALGGLMDDFTQMIKLKPIMKVMRKSSSEKVVKEANKVFQKVARENPMSLESVMEDIFDFMNDQDTSVKLALLKSMTEVAKKTPEIVPIPPIVDLLSDDDSFIRESATIVLGHLGSENPGEIIDLLINEALNDDEWNVRDAAVLSLGNTMGKLDDKALIIEKLVSLLGDEQGWVRRSAMKILSETPEVNSSQIPFDILSSNFKHEDSNVREASADLLVLYSDQIDLVFDNIIRLLGDESESVRASAISAVIEIINKISLEKILSRLLQNLSDQASLNTQQSIARILGRTAKYKDDKIKKRVIALLKIRCEMSQDPIICKVLHEFEESLNTK